MARKQKNNRGRRTLSAEEVDKRHVMNRRQEAIEVDKDKSKRNVSKEEKNIHSGRWTDLNSTGTATVTVQYLTVNQCNKSNHKIQK